MNVATSKSKGSVWKTWLSAMRFRTLPLALASTITGGFLALDQTEMNWLVFALTALTTVLLQINSNLANDFGDFQHGTDNEDRIGPERALQSGRITAAGMRKAIIAFSAMALFSGSALLYLAPIWAMAKIFLFILGLAAIAASIRYTAGKNPYGYRGLGDAYVVVFFGLTGVLGAHYLQTAVFDPLMLLPALAIGGFSAGVLNVNNTRDIESDRKAGKNTLAVRLGPINARRYHFVLLLISTVLLIAYGVNRFTDLNDWLFLLLIPLIGLNAYKVVTVTDASRLDPWLKQLALTTFGIALLIAIGQWL